jgi:hypothetical protein
MNTPPPEVGHWDDNFTVTGGREMVVE